jgi:hypothetical protein
MVLWLQDLPCLCIDLPARTMIPGSSWHSPLRMNCKRGDTIMCGKEQFQLFADRTNSSVKLRLWFSALAYLMVISFKKHSLASTELTNAEPVIIWTKLFKLAVKITMCAKRVYLSFADCFPPQDFFQSTLTAYS